MSSSHDFDFLAGRWSIAHRRLQRRLEDCTQWDEFPGTCDATLILGGHGNMDDNVLELPAGTYRAATFRAFDAAAGRWSIWWLDARRGQIDPPVHGTFVDGVGTFYGDDVWEGQPVLVRFQWSDITATAARWQQAFSTDQGKTWETNWIMQFTRMG